MRILTAVRDMGPGGTQRAAQNCSLAYDTEGHAVAVLAFGGAGPRAECLTARQIPVFVGGAGPEELERALDAAVAWKPDLVHVHRQGFADPIWGKMLRRIKEASSAPVRVVETSHFSRADGSEDRLLFDVHLQLSKWCMWKWRRWTGGQRPRPLGIIVPHMIDATAFTPVSTEERQSFRAEHGISDGTFVFGRIGQPTASSWSPIILDAFERVAGARPDASLLLVGLPEPLQPRVDALPPPLRKRVVQIPFLSGDESLRQAYGAMDVFLHASLCGETFGMVLCEAALCGCPAITLSTPMRGNSQLEVVGHERGGLVVTDLESMVTAMERMITDEDERHRLARNAAAWVREQYDVDRVAAMLLEILELVRSEPTRGDLEAAIERRDDLVTDVGSDEIRALLAGSLGRPSWKEILMMRLGHVPWLHHQWSRAKRALRSS